MTTRAEAIAAHVADLMRTPAMTSVAAIDVYRSLGRALDAETTTALVIEPGDEPEPSGEIVGFEVRRLELRVIAIAKGAEPDTLADAPLLEAHNRLLTDPTLGGLAMRIDEGATKRERADLDRPAAAITKSYIVTYRTEGTSLE